MNKTIIYILIFLIGTIVSSLAQILLKKQAVVKAKSFLKEYFNIRTIVAYGLFFSSTICTLIAYKSLPLSMGPILGTSEYFFVALLSRLILHETISSRKKLGLILIIIGIFIFSI